MIKITHNVGYIKIFNFSLYTKYPNTHLLKKDYEDFWCDKCYDDKNFI